MPSHVPKAVDTIMNKTVSVLKNSGLPKRQIKHVLGTHTQAWEENYLKKIRL